MIAELYFLAENIFFKIKDYNQWLTCLQISLGVYLSLNQNDQCYFIMNIYCGISVCLGRFEDSLVYLHIAVNRQYLKEDITDYRFNYSAFDRAIALQYFGKC